MKIKRLLSIAFIFPVLLSSAICFSQYDFDLVSLRNVATNQIAAEDGDSQHEFRETIKISLSQFDEIRDVDSFSDLILQTFQLSREASYACYLQKHRSILSSGKKFIELSTLII